MIAFIGLHPKGFIAREGKLLLALFGFCGSAVAATRTRSMTALAITTTGAFFDDMADSQDKQGE